MIREKLDDIGAQIAATGGMKVGSFFFKSNTDLKKNKIKQEIPNGVKVGA